MEQRYNPACSICKEEYATDEKPYPVIALRVGCRKISEKHKKSYFHPDTFDDDEEEKLFHLHCLRTVGFDFADAADYRNSMRCVFCGCTLWEEALYFELELGHFVVKSELIWIPQRDKSQIIRRIYSCWDCIFDTLGEGDPHLARFRLGIEAEADRLDTSRPLHQIYPTNP